jgi:hypothetical protein
VYITAAVNSYTIVTAATHVAARTLARPQCSEHSPDAAMSALHDAESALSPDSTRAPGGGRGDGGMKRFRVLFVYGYKGETHCSTAKMLGKACRTAAQTLQQQRARPARDALSYLDIKRICFDKKCA